MEQVRIYQLGSPAPDFVWIPVEKFLEAAVVAMEIVRLADEKGTTYDDTRMDRDLEPGEQCSVAAGGRRLVGVGRHGMETEETMSTESELERLRDEVVDMWHDSNSKKPLHEHLGMTDVEYAAWVEQRSEVAGEET